MAAVLIMTLVMALLLAYFTRRAKSRMYKRLLIKVKLHTAEYERALFKATRAFESLDVSGKELNGAISGGDKYKRPSFRLILLNRRGSDGGG